MEGAVTAERGLQFKSVETLHQELKRLPMNQILAMFQKTVKKITLSINRIVEDSLTDGKDASGETKNTEIMVKRMRHVAEKTLEEDVREGFKNQENAGGSWCFGIPRGAWWEECGGKSVARRSRQQSIRERELIS